MYHGIRAIICSFAFIILLNSSCRTTEEATTETVSIEIAMIIDGNADPEHFFTPVDITVDDEGKIFILDFQRMTILVFSEEGEFMYEFGGNGGGPGEFGSLHMNFDLDNRGLVYTIDNRNIIKIFNNDGTYRSQITVNTGEIFDIDALDSSRIYINCLPSGPSLLTSSSMPAAMLIDSSGSVIREVGLLETDSEDLGTRKMVFSCAIGTDEDNSVYYTSLSDYQVYKYDSTGAFVWSVEGPSSMTAYSERSADGNLLYPVVWDLDVDRERVYVLWAQGGDDRGYRVDVFDAGDGAFTGYFYTQTPSDERNMAIEVDGNDFYTLDFDFGMVNRYSMNSPE